MKKFPHILLLALFAFLASEVVMVFKNRTVNASEAAAGLQNSFMEVDQNLQEKMAFFLGDNSVLTEDYLIKPSQVSYLQSLFLTNGFAFYLFADDSLTFWSNNSVPFNIEQLSLNDKGVIMLQNGWYFYRKLEDKQKTIIGLFKIYSLFKYQNKFLVNDFHPSLGNVSGMFFLTDKGDQIGYRVLDSEGDFAFSLISRRESGFVKARPVVIISGLLLAVLSLMGLVVFFFRQSVSLLKSGEIAKGLTSFALLLLGIRLFVFITGLPSAITGSTLFSPEFYASSWVLPSLGDLLLNVIVFSFFGYLLYTARSYVRLNLTNSFLSIIGTLIAFSAIVFISWQSILVMQGLVLNSQLSLGVGFVFDFNLLNFFGFFIIAILFFSVFFYSQFLFDLVLAPFNQKRIFWLAAVLFFTLLLASAFFKSEFGFLVLGLWGSLLLVFFLSKTRLFSRASFGVVFVAFFLFSVLSTLALLQFNLQKSQQQRKALALTLSSDQDHLAEFLFLEMEETLFDDDQLKNLVVAAYESRDALPVYRYLYHHYFYDFWDKYEIQVTTTKPGEKWEFTAMDIEMPIDEFFQEIIDTFGIPTISQSLVFLDNSYYPGRKSYITKIPIEAKSSIDEDTGYLVFIEFNTKFGVRETGLPELLVDDRADVYRGFEDLSYAKYLDGRLVHKIGNYVYSFDLSVYGDFEEQFSFFDLDGHEHLLYKKNENFHLLVSSPKNSFIENIAPFSYMFILMFLISLLLSRERVSEWLQITFKRRVQIYMVGLVAVSVVSIGVVSSIFLLKIYEQKNLDTVNEKSQSVLYEIQTIFGNQDALSERYDYFVFEELLRLHRVFFTDINIFSPRGLLVASSRPRVFEDGLIGNSMNPLAFAYLQSQQKGQFIHNERIGNLQFVSSYLPLHNNFGELIGYINLPYFARQSQLRNEMSLFVLAFVNIITILLMVALIVALIASNYVTAPLQLIKDSISRIQLGRTNQKLQWKRGDEIGQLVAEYNRMIDEIESSAELLAKSERESAWREMAKQVAHEIKNPLTPMRLSIQHLEKAYRDNMPDWDQRLTRFSKTMIEQIDNLSVIASEFSDFAKMPAGKKAKMDFGNFVAEAIELFNNSDRVTLNLEFGHLNKPLLVMADKNQLTRVFNNLVNNAIQAYSKNENALVEVRVVAKNSFVKCSVTDYGCGIADEDKENIFRPYFTTKTGGMGLGLSMVKSIIENHGGSVGFDSKSGVGTTFSFTIPLL